MPDPVYNPPNRTKESDAAWNMMPIGGEQFNYRVSLARDALIINYKSIRFDRGCGEEGPSKIVPC
jgi:hypothetical protein